MALESLSWKQTRKTPERLARKAKPNLSESVLHDPGYADRRSNVDLLNILSGLPGAEIAMAKGLGGLGMLGAGIVKPKGGNWLSGSVEDALRGLKRGDDQRAIDAVRRLRPDLADREVIDFINPQTSSENLPINQWIEGPLTKYVKTRMASPDDEVRRLAEQGVLHFEPAVYGAPDAVMARSHSVPRNLPLTEDPHTWELKLPQDYAGPGARLGKSDLAQGWEDATDNAVNLRRWEEDDFGPIAIKNNPWVEKLESGTPVYSPAHFLRNSENLGFPHLVDELSNALNPASGLPRNLQISPEAMKQMSMEKAVRRVAEINAWRAAQKVEANRKLAEQAALVREYAENNPKGLRWVELKPSEKVLPEGWSERVDPKTGEKYYYNKEFGSQTAHPFEDRAFADQLKYEGDTMGHCVGGYCDDVLSGRSRIFSLRDAKGEPHVTVEVAPGGYADLPHEIRYKLNRADLASEGIDSAEWLRRNYPDLELKPFIKQIKGKQNKAPNEEYLPFVQDFVRNNPLGGQWSDVGDLGNTRLTKHSTGKYVSDAEANALAQRHFGDARMGNKPDDIENPWQYANRIRRYDPEMLSDTDKAFLADWEAGNFAQGGPVSTLPAEPGSGYNSWQSVFGEAV